MTRPTAQRIRATLRAVAAALVVCVLAGGCAMLERTQQRTVSAIMPSASNLFEGSEVRVLGLQVGQVTAITPQGDTIRVDMSVDAEQELPADVEAHLVPVTLLGERILQLEPPYTGGPSLEDGGVIPLERARTPAEVDEVLRSFDNFLSALDEQTLAELIDTATETFSGQGPGLNRLVDQGAETVEVLSDASGDLNAFVTEFADLNETLATRDEKIGRTLERLSTVMVTLAEEKGEIIEGIGNLRRLNSELRPLLDEHTDPLIRDLEILTTTLSTVNRNLGRLEDTYAGSRRLTADFGPQVHEYEEGRVALNNRGEPLFEAIQLRLQDRLTGLCIRLGIAECADFEFWAPVVPILTCLEEQDSDCEEGKKGLADALAEALGALPEDARDELARQARQEQRRRQQSETQQQQPRQRQRQRAEPEPEPSPTPSERASERRAPLPLPSPDPRLDRLRRSSPTGGVPGGLGGG